MKPTIILKFWVAAAVISVCAPGPSLSAESSAVQEIKIGYTSTSISVFPIEFARRKGFLRDEGLNIRHRWRAHISASGLVHLSGCARPTRWPESAELAKPAEPSQAVGPELRVNAHGFSLHAAVRWRADQRKELEQLCRYITRQAIANERLKPNRAGQIVLQLKSPYKDGTTHIVMEPLEFMERLAALVPRPRLHLIRFHGVLAPNAKLRSKIVPAPAERATEPPTDHAQVQGETPRMSWARLLKRVFDIDVKHCPNCGGALKIIAAIEDPPVIIKILSHLGLPTRAPPRAPARRVDLFQII